MALNIFLLSTPWTAFVISAGIIIVLAVILTVIERVLNRKIVSKKEFEENIYLKKIKHVIDSQESIKGRLKEVDKIAKDFFNEIFNISKQTSYYDLAKRFKKENKNKMAEFCEKMMNAFYSGEELKMYQLNRIINLLVDIQEEEKEKEIRRKIAELKIKEDMERQKAGEEIKRNAIKKPGKLQEPIQTLKKPDKIEEKKSPLKLPIDKNKKEDIGFFGKIFSKSKPEPAIQRLIPPPIQMNLSNKPLIKPSKGTEKNILKENENDIPKLETPPTSYDSDSSSPESGPKVSEKTLTPAVKAQKNSGFVYGMNDLNRIKNNIEKRKRLASFQRR